MHSGAVKAADDAIITGYTTADTNLQNQIDNVNTNKLNKTQKATASPIMGIKYAESDVRGVDPALVTSYQNGIMTWRDKAELQALGKWYECVPGKPTEIQTQFKSIEPHSKLWINPALRIVYLRFYYKDFNSWAEGKKEADIWMPTTPDIRTEAGDPSIFWDQIAPIYTIWGPTNVPYIQIGVDADGIFRIRSSEKVTSKKTIAGSLFWFYRDNSSYGRWKYE